jgi:hypothetical protein
VFLGDFDLLRTDVKLFKIFRFPGEACFPVALLLTAGFAFFGFPPDAAASSRSKTKPSVTNMDQDYVSALTAANDFLHAWQVQDGETGILLLSDSFKHHSSPELIEAFLQPAVGTNRSYEISHGKKMKDGSYSFPVTLFELASGKTGTVKPRYTQIVVVKAGKNDWAIDKLP